MYLRVVSVNTRTPAHSVSDRLRPNAFARAGLCKDGESNDEHGGVQQGSNVSRQMRQVRAALATIQTALATIQTAINSGILAFTLPLGTAVV